MAFTVDYYISLPFFPFLHHHNPLLHACCSPAFYAESVSDGASVYVSRFVAIFLGIYRNFVHLCLIIWLLDVQHRLVPAHTLSQHDNWVCFLLNRFDVFSGFRVCVLNFYAFIIPYFEPFVHCWPSSSSSTSSIEILWGVFSLFECVFVWIWENGAKIRIESILHAEETGQHRHISVAR